MSIPKVNPPKVWKVLTTVSVEEFRMVKSAYSKNCSCVTLPWSSHILSFTENKAENLQLKLFKSCAYFLHLNAYCTSPQKGLCILNYRKVLKFEGRCWPSVTNITPAGVQSCLWVQGLRLSPAGSY